MSRPARRLMGRPRPLHNHPEYIARGWRRIVMLAVWVGLIVLWLSLE